MRAGEPKAEGFGVAALVPAYVADGTPQELEQRAPSGRLDDVFRQVTVKEAA